MLSISWNIDDDKSKMLNRILQVPRQSFFLLGPRGSGKSTWLRATFPDAHFVDLQCISGHASAQSTCDRIRV